MENRSSKDLQQSLICLGENGKYTLPPPNTPYYYSNGNYDTAILEIINNNTNQSILYFKSTLSICIVGDEQECDQITDGRGANVAVPYLRLRGQLAGCDNQVPDYKTLILYPADGQTLVQLQNELIQLAGRS